MYLSANELGIEEWERNQLVKLVDTLPNTKHNSHNDSFKVGGTGCTFNMDYGFVDYQCGTVSCIGGTMYANEYGQVTEQGYIIDEFSTDDYIYKHPVLADLFFPDIDDFPEYDMITPAQAAIVIKHYLTTGEIDWTLALDPE
jgi:hypothetical protein